MLKISIIGVSGFGQTHYNDLMREAASGKLQITAATVINQDEESEKCQRLKEHGCKLFTDYRQMLDEFAGQLDLVCIPTGIHLHTPMAVAAMQAGANAFIEKPAAATIQDVDLMRDCEKATGRKTWVGFQHIYQPAVQRAKQLILSGKIGKLKQVKTLCLWPRNHAYYNRNKWAGCLRNGDIWVLDSPFNNATAHYLNIALFWSGMELARSADLESCSAELYRVNRIESPDTAAIRLLTTNGVEINYYCSHAVKELFGPEIEAVCEQGVIRFKTDSVDVYYENGAVENLGQLEFTSMRENIFNAMVNRLKGKDDFVCDLEIARCHTLAVNAVHDAAEVVEIPEKYHLQDEYNGSAIELVAGLEVLMHKCFETSGMPGDFNPGWTRPAGTISLTDYKVFSGDKIK